MRYPVLCFLALLTIVADLSIAHGQSYPDITARSVAEKLSEKWARQVVVDNRGGASGMIGGQIVATSPPDGHTILLSSSSEVALNVALYAKMPYDPRKAFAPITLISSTPMILVTHPALPPKTMRDFVAFVAARPGQLNYASGGNGTPQHFAGELLRLQAKLIMTHIPYKSGGLQVIDLVAGQVPCGFAALLPAMPHIKSGRLRGLAVTSLKRSPSLPEIPAMAESGYSGFNIVQWYAAWTSAGTPK
jgi:tripartite-type tricarboxylate transporter receptor subunit TctC